MKIKILINLKSTLIKGLLILMFGMLGDISWGQNIQGGTTPTLTATPTDATFGGYGNLSPWFMAWDDTYLYVGKTGGSAGEALIIYLDLDPTSPANGGVSGGGNAAGNQIGNSDWSCTPTLPFNADIRIYATNNYLEYSSRNGSGGWNTSVNITTGNIGNDGTTNRTLRFQWTLGSIVGARPTSFNWVGYQISTTSFIYNQIPSANASGTQNTPRLYFYQTVANTNSTSTTNPFSSNQLSFETRVGFGYTSSFAGTVFDYTVNGGTSTLSTSLNVRNNFVLNNGDFRSSGSQNLTLSGVNGSGILQINNNNGATLTGTDAGSGNDINLIISTSGKITLNGNATSNTDHDKKFLSCTVNNGAIFELSRGLLIRYGTFTVNGTLQINSNGYIQSGVASSIAASYSSSTGSLIYNNAGSYSITAFEWPASIGPNSITIQNSGTNLTIGSSRTISATGSMTVNAGCSFTVSSGQTLTTNNNLTLKSDATGTASIGNSAGSISGDVTVERYIPANGRRYRFLASPVVGGTSLQWRNNATNVSGRGIQITGGSNASLYDVSTNNSPSAFTYNETNTTGTINDPAKWSAIDGSTTLTNGVGYRVFVRGDRSIDLTTVNSTNNATTIWVKGTYPSGTRSLPVTYTSSGGNGWNLVGNPYPCSIDFTSGSGWSKTNIGTGVAIYRPSSNSYAYSITNGDVTGNVTVVSTNGGSNIIGSGQAFWVKATASSPSLSCTEAVKVTSAPPTVLLKTTPSNQLKLKLTQDSSNIDETVIAFGEKFSDDYLETEDVNKLVNATVNISSVVGIEQYAAINFTSNNYKEKTIPLSVWGNINGNYQLDLTQVEGFDATVTLFLKDKFLNTTTTIDQNKSINFSITDDSLSKGDFRFELLFKNTNTNANEISSSILNTNLTVYPNPATDILNINLSNANFKNSNIVIYNVSGMEVSKSIMNGASAQLNIESLSNGVYFVKVSNENGFSKTVKFVK